MDKTQTPISRRKKQHETDKTQYQAKWFTRVWRPAMAWVYMAICIFDFIIAPSGVAILITFHNSSIPAWNSLTLSNGGIMHVAFGAILGVTAWGRTKEKINELEVSPPTYK